MPESNPLRVGVNQIDALPQFLARFEMRDIFAPQRDSVAGFGIAPHPGRSEMQTEAAETPDLDSLSAGKLLTHGFKQALDRKFDILYRKMALVFRQRLDQI